MGSKPLGGGSTAEGRIKANGRRLAVVGKLVVVLAVAAVLVPIAASPSQAETSWQGTVRVTHVQTELIPFTSYYEKIATVITGTSWSTSAELTALSLTPCSDDPPIYKQSLWSDYHADGAGSGARIAVAEAYVATSDSWEYIVIGETPHEFVTGGGTFSWSDPCTGQSGANPEVYNVFALSGVGAWATYAEKQQVLFGSSTSGTITTTWSVYRTDCDETVDSDADGYGDCEEARQGHDPNDPTDSPDPTDGGGGDEDGDGDGVPDSNDQCPGSDDRLDEDGDGIPDGCDDDRDNDGVPNSIDDCPAIPGSPENDGCPVCSVEFSDSAAWSGRVPVPLSPDVDLFDFEVEVDWCTDGADYAEVEGIRVNGSIDGGLDFVGLGVLGFEPKFVSEAVDFGPNRWEGSAQGEFAMCWDWTDLLDRLGAKDKLRDKARSKVQKRVERWLKKNGVFDGPAASSEVLVEIDKLIVWARGKIDKIDEKLYRYLPDRLADEIEDSVEDPFSVLMDSWKNKIAEELFFGNYNGLEAEIIADRIVKELDDLVFGLFQVCDNLVMWNPIVHVSVGLSGAKFDFSNVYLHQLMVASQD